MELCHRHRCRGDSGKYCYAIVSRIGNTRHFFSLYSLYITVEYIDYGENVYLAAAGILMQSIERGFCRRIIRCELCEKSCELTMIDDKDTVFLLITRENMH